MSPLEEPLEAVVDATSAINSGVEAVTGYNLVQLGALALVAGIGIYFARRAYGAVTGNNVSSLQGANGPKLQSTPKLTTSPAMKQIGRGARTNAMHLVS